jgi:Flp pilus assembly protein TadD
MEPNSLSLELVPIETPVVPPPGAEDGSDENGSPTAANGLELVPDTNSADLTIDYAEAAKPLVRPLPKPAAAPISTENATPAVNSDRFLAEASKEYKEGHIDQLLWAHSLTQASGDKTTAIVNYLRARATSLRRMDKEQQSKALARESRHAEAMGAPELPDETWPNESGRGRLHGGKSRKFYLTVVGASLAGVIACVGLIAAFWGGDSPQQPMTASNAGSAQSSGSAARREAQRTPARAANDEEVAKRAREEMVTKIAELSNAGNWNVLVLFATEWTRREPENAAAWNQLGIGFGNLRQFDDAHDAAAKAVKLAPGDSLYWRNLAQASLDLNQPADALKAFEQAATLNPLDVHSIVQTGILNWRLGRVPEAKVAVDLALAASPDDPDALCLKTLVAQQPVAPKDANATAKPLPLAEGKCVEVVGPQTVAVAGSTRTAPKAVPSARH